MPLPLPCQAGSPWKQYLIYVHLVHVALLLQHHLQVSVGLLHKRQMGVRAKYRVASGESMTTSRNPTTASSQIPERKPNILPLTLAPSTPMGQKKKRK